MVNASVLQIITVIGVEDAKNATQEEITLCAELLLENKMNPKCSKEAKYSDPRMNMFKSNNINNNSLSFSPFSSLDPLLGCFRFRL